MCLRIQKTLQECIRVLFPFIAIYNLAVSIFLLLSNVILLQVLQECPDESESIYDQEQFDEIEAVGKSLLDRLTVPVVYPDGYVVGLALLTMQCKIFHYA